MAFLIRTGHDPSAPAWPGVVRDAWESGFNGVAWSIAHHGVQDLLTQSDSAAPIPAVSNRPNQPFHEASHEQNRGCKKTQPDFLSIPATVVLSTLPNMSSLASMTKVLVAAIETVATVARDAGRACATLEKVEGVPPFVRYQDALNATWRLLQNVRWPAEQWGVEIGIVPGAAGCFLSPPELRDFLDGLHSHVFGAALNVQDLVGIGRLEDWLETLRHRARVLHAFGGDSSSAAPQPAGTPCSNAKQAADRFRFAGTVILEHAEQLSAWKL